MSVFRPHRSVARAGTLLLAGPLLILSGCSWLPTTSVTDAVVALDTDFARSRLIVRDVVGTLVQIPSLSPLRTTLVSDVPDSRFGELLLAQLQDAGYDLRIGPVSEQAGRVSWRIDPSREAGATAEDWTVIVSARQVRIKRSYRADTHGVQPVSSMFVHGADSTRLTVDRALFDQAPIAPVAPPSQALQASATDRTPTEVQDGAGVRVLPVRVPPVPESLGARTAPVPGAIEGQPLSNMFLTNRSRYEPLLASFEPIESLVMVFPNDSLSMGRENKRLARLMSERFDPSRDVISVIGCSHGATALANGNSVLANGRSWRVKDEFVRVGIDETLVLEEGCWAGVAHSRMPARGVVVTHRRRAG